MPSSSSADRCAIWRALQARCKEGMKDSSRNTKAIRRALSPDIILGEVPFDKPFLFRGKVYQVRAGCGVMSRHGIFPIRLARADRFEEMAEMRERWLRPFVLEILHRGGGARLHF